MFVMLVTCRRYLAVKGSECRALWLERLGWPYAFVVGRWLGDEPGYDPATHVLIVDAPDTYEDLSAKVIAGVNAVRDRFPEALADGGLFKIDDDVLVRPRRLRALAPALRAAARARPDGVAYVGVVNHFPEAPSTYHFGKVSPASRWHNVPIVVPPVPYCRGPCYWLSPAAAACLVAYARPADHLYEDTMVGLTLFEHTGARPLPYPLFTDRIARFLLDPRVPALHGLTPAALRGAHGVHRALDEDPADGGARTYLLLGAVVAFLLLVWWGARRAAPPR